MLLFILFALNLSVAAEPIRVAVVDSGLNINDPRFKFHLCSSGHYDATGEGLTDSVGHGTSVVSLIIQYARDANYCLQIVKAFSSESEVVSYTNALRKATNVSIVNISMSGRSYLPKEDGVIKYHPEITYVVAAGNDGVDLDNWKRYPASLNRPNMLVVGSVNSRFKLSIFSNYGTIVESYEMGENVPVALPWGNGTLSGTSMSTAIKTGKLIYETYFKTN